MKKTIILTLLMLLAILSIAVSIKFGRVANKIAIENKQKPTIEWHSAKSKSNKASIISVVYVVGMIIVIGAKIKE